MSRSRFWHSPFTPVGVAVVAVIAFAIRWYVQGSHNVYTALAKRFYVPDPDLGWRVSTQHPIWLGVDAGGILVAIAVAVVAAGFVIRRRERMRNSPAKILRAGSWIVAAGSLAIPAAAFATGPGPLHGRDTLPARAAVLIETGIQGSLDAREGTYVVVSHAGTSVTAQLSAGGEAFDARFARDIVGEWRGDPRDLRRPMHAAVSVAAASVDTGIAERSKHAREGYLHADQFPRIALALDAVTAVRPLGANEVAFRAPATLQLMGRTHAVSITGTLLKPDASALTRLELVGDVLLVQADLSLAISDTALASKAADFDGDRISIHVSLVLRRTGG